MRWFTISTMAVMISLGVRGLAYADAFDPHQVPDDSIYALHIDVDAMRDGKTWDIIEQKLAHLPGARSKINDVEQLTGLSFPKGLHDVTIWGSTLGDEAAVIIFHADFDKDRVLGVLSTAADHAVNVYRDYDIHSWTDHEKHMFGAVAPKGLAIIARSEKNVQKVLDAMDGNVASIKADSVRNAGNKPGVLIYATGQQLAALKNNNPVFAQVDTAWASIVQEGENVVLRITAVGKTADVAIQMRNSAEGIKAMVSLATADNANADPKAKLAAKLLKDMTSKVEGTSASVTIPVPLEIVRDLVENGLPRENGRGEFKPADPQ